MLPLFLAAWLALGPGQGLAQQKEDKVTTPEEDDYKETPYTEYGEFNEQEDEESDAQFFQHGRFFGVSVGLGGQAVSGYRGALWKGGFPLIAFRVHCWFDFNFALQLGLFNVNHTYSSNAKGGSVDVSVFHLGTDLKYYFNTKNISAAVTFANPNVVLGLGAYSKGETTTADGNTARDTAVGLSVGGGVEFPIKPRKAYFAVEGRYHWVNYQDRLTTVFQSTDGLPSLEGGFWTVTGSFLFTW